ncbi:MAG: c-type cytochrome [Gemmatimonadota bacterium]
MISYRHLLFLALAAGCSGSRDESPPPDGLADWRPPADSTIPADSMGNAIRRGLALLVDTRDSLPRYALSNLNCTSCHLDGGRVPNAAPLYGVHARYPRYLDRTGAVIPIADRVNYCFTRSLAGNRLPTDSREMQDILAYFSFISQGVPIGAELPGEGMPKMPPLPADSSRGSEAYRTVCAACHGPDGQGVARAPALWGPKSYSIGASMARVERAASFVRHNMPFGAPGSITEQQAWDVALFINSQPRPDMPGKEDDWPLGGAPPDVPYATKGRLPPSVIPVIPRSNPKGAQVPAPRRASGGGDRKAAP